MFPFILMIIFNVRVVVRVDMENSAVDGVMKSKDVMPQFRRDTSVGKPDDKDVAVDRRESQGDVAEEHESLAC